MYISFRRLQDDLATCTNETRCMQNELELAKRQIDDLKRQLQQYVAEIKRTEDLISQKEIERSEMLDQFRSLSQEANLLENSNHTLESEANQTKLQLSAALGHASDLEHRLDCQESVIKSYEKQVRSLSILCIGLEEVAILFRQVKINIIIC